MTEIDLPTNQAIAPSNQVVSSSTSPPPHPLDGEWYMHTGDQAFGPFTGYKLREFVRDGRLGPDTQVVRAGTDNWIDAKDDSALRQLFGTALQPPTSIRNPSSPEPYASVAAAAGATIVQVTNNLAPAPRQILIEEGEAKPKSAGTALLLSILITGLGQIYNGQVAKGIGMFVLAIAAWFILLGWIIMIWSWIDAYQNAKSMNLRYQRRLAAGVII